MEFRIAVNFGRRCLENFGPGALGEAQHVDGAVHAGLGRLHRIVLIVNWRSQAGEIVDLLHLDIERVRDVVPHQLESRVADQMRDVLPAAAEEIIDAQHVVTLLQETLA